METKLCLSLLSESFGCVRGRMRGAHLLGGGDHGLAGRPQRVEPLGRFDMPS